MFQPKVAEKMKTHIFAIYEIIRKNMVQPEATDDNLVHALCRLDKGSKNTNTFRIFNTYCCSIATVAT